MGAGGDSFYEYLLKSWIQTNDSTARKMYDDAIDAYEANGLFRYSNQSHLLIVAETVIGQYPGDIGSHLGCFAGGMFALGAATDPRNQTSGGKQQRDLELGKNFTNTCHEAYIRSATRIGKLHITLQSLLQIVSHGRVAMIIFIYEQDPNTLNSPLMKKLSGRILEVYFICFVLK